MTDEDLDPYEATDFDPPEAVKDPGEPEVGLHKTQRDLTPKQRAFVRAMSQMTRDGKPNYTEAARLAGYSGSRASLGVIGSKLAHDPKIRLAMQEEARGMLYDGAQVAVSALVAIIHDRTIGVKDRIKASTAILNRTGLNEVTQHEVTVGQALSEAEKIRQAISLAKELGLNPRDMLAKVGITVDDQGKRLAPPEPEPVEIPDDAIWKEEWGEWSPKRHVATHPGRVLDLKLLRQEVPDEEPVSVPDGLEDVFG